MSVSVLDNPFLAPALTDAADDVDGGEGDRNPEPPAPEPPPATRTGGEPLCEECGLPVEWSGRGRKPKFHPEHRPKTRTSASASRPATPAANKATQARLDAIVGDLQEGVGQLAGTIMPIAPVTAGTMLLTGPDATVALVRIAADHPRMLDGLEAAAKAVPFMAVGKFVAGLMLAVAVDMGRLAPVGLAAEYLKVAEAAEKVGWQPPQSTMEAQQNPAGDWTVPPPPRFTMPK